MARKSSAVVEAAASVAANSRELVFQDGSSHKFWNISLDGCSHTVRFGRVGTSGQEQTKEFASEEAARKSFDKLVAEKLKKGYTDAGGTTTSAAPSAGATAKTSKRRGAKAATPTEGEPQPPTAAETPAPESAAPIDLQVTRRIDLTPSDWQRATFRPRQLQERGEPAPFDQDACVQQLSKLRTESYGWDLRWHDLKLPVAMSRQEAHFWLDAMTAKRDRDVKPKAFATGLAKKTFDGKVDLESALKLISRSNRGIPEQIVLPLINLFPADKLLELTLAEPIGKEESWERAQALEALMHGFSRNVLPYLSEKELEAARGAVRKKWDPSQFPTDFYKSLPAACYLAAMLGMHEEVYTVVSSWEDDRFRVADWCDHYQRPQDMVFGLGSAAQVEEQWRRLKLRMRNADHVRAFLACTEYAALDCVRESVVTETRKETCEQLLQALALVRAPEAAEPMLECKLSAKAPRPAREWLDTYVGNAVTGLLTTAAGRGRVADAAVEYLRGVKRQGHADLITDGLKKVKDADVVAKVQRLVLEHEEKEYAPLTDATTPKWLRKELEAADKIKSRKLPSWATPAGLPPLTVGDNRLNDQQTTYVLQFLAATPINQRHPLLEALRREVDRHIRDEFAWKLFQLWLEDGAPSKEKWAMAALGHLGGDACALRLTPLVRAWPGESQHQRAVFGLECLRAIGSDAALMQLAGVAQKLKFKGLKAKAEQFVNDIAAEKGLTRAELEDRIVPDCGLDEQGRREFNFGPRSFSFVLGPGLKAMIRDADGKLRSDLPKPGAKDDAQLSQQALADWKLLKKQIREVAQIQAGRLEQAMVTGRRWNVGDFETLIVQHPLMTHLARQLLWGAFDEQGERIATFRITEERDYADADDNAASLAGAAAVGVLHPLEMADEERARWGEVLSDYEIVSPFPQLGRATYSLTPAEAKQDDLQQCHGMKLVAPTLVFTLEKLGWTRGVGLDGGGFDEHSKQFPAANVTAVVNYEGAVGMGYISPDEILTVTSCHFVEGMREPSGYGWGSKKTMKLSKVPPVVISEVLADLQMLRSKSK